MARRPNTDEIAITIRYITDIRTSNNELWMEVLRLGFEVAPKRARKIMRKIVSNDRKISKCLGKL